MADPNSEFNSSNLAQPAPDASSEKRLAAAFASLVLPGLGHWLVSRRGMGLLFFAFFCGLLVMCWPLRLLNHWVIVILIVFGQIGVSVFAAVDATYGGGNRIGRPSQWWLALILPLTIAAAIIHNTWAVTAAGFKLFQVPSRSMENTVPLDSRVMVDLWYYRKTNPARGDLVVFRNRQGIYLIKRVIAGPGETIEGRDGAIVIDGRTIDEPYVIHSGNPLLDMKKFGPLTVPDGRLFVMGDNRDVSLDSRSPEVGPIAISSLYGKVLYTMPAFGAGGSKPLQ